MKSGWRACSPDGFIIFPRGGQAAKPLCLSTTRNTKRSESGVLNNYKKNRVKAYARPGKIFRNFLPHGSICQSAHFAAVFIYEIIIARSNSYYVCFRVIKLESAVSALLFQVNSLKMYSDRPPFLIVDGITHVGRSQVRRHRFRHLLRRNLPVAGIIKPASAVPQ